MRLWRWVVPVRGSPAMMMGRAISMSWISGWRRRRSSIRRRFLIVWTSWLYQETTPGGLRPASVRSAAQRISRRSRKRSSPASSRPVCWRAAAQMCVGLEGTGRGHLGHGRPELVDLGGEAGGGQVVEDDGRRPAHADARALTTTGPDRRRWSAGPWAGAGWRRGGTSGTRCGPGGGRRWRSSSGGRGPAGRRRGARSRPAS